MKLYAGLAAAALMICNSVSAQHSSQPVTIGIKGGLNLYHIQGQNYDTKAGFNAGLLGHIHLSKQWALQPEIVYSQQGAQADVSNSTGKVKLNYINVPVMFQYMFDNGFRLEAGPQLGILASAKYKLNSATTDIKNNYKTADVGIGAGIGYVHPPSGFGVDARYVFGVTPINKGGTTDLMNRGAQIGVFYLIHHRGR